MTLTFTAYSGAKEVKKGISIENLAEYKEKNPSHTFKSEGVEKTGKEKFISTLSPTQLEDVRNGYKTIKYSSNIGDDGEIIGYYLLHVKEKEASTPRLLDSNKRQYILSFLRSNASELFGAFENVTDVDVDEEFFTKTIKSLL